MSRFITIILLVCVWYPSIILAQSTGKDMEKPKFVMILSSYSYENEWSTALTKEIHNQLETQKIELKVRTTYAGIAAHTSFVADRFAMQGAFAYGRLNNQISLPDVLILVGDESWMLYRVMNHRGIWGRIPVVLCGVHSEVMKDYRQFFSARQLPDTSFISLKASAGALQTTAVIEPDNAAQTLRLAQTLVPRLQHLYYLSDGSYTDSYARKRLLRQSERQDVSFVTLQVNRSNADSIRQLLNKLPAEAIVVTNGVAVPKDVRVPVLTLRDMDYQSHTPLGGYFAPVSAFATKTAEAVLRILETGKADSIPYVFASDTAFYLNETALMYAGLSSTVKALPGVAVRNVPPPFIIRHIRVIALVLLIIIVAAFVAVRTVYFRRYRRSLNALFERYKTLYDEYKVVYENMPVGLMLFDVYGNLLNRNAETDVFFEQFAHAKSYVFHLFDSDVLDDEMRTALFRKELVSTMIHLPEYCYRIQCCLIADEETGDNHILMIVIDNTDIEKERKAKEQICNVLNFAMNKAVIGVAEYNLVDGLGFATDAWYDTLGVERNTADFSQTHQCLVPADREKVNLFLKHVRYGASYPFLDSLQMETRAGESHYIRYLIQPLEYVPDKGRIIVAEMVLNMDEQIAKEHELKIAMKKAQEADRFKNAFVANMKDEIRTPLKEIIRCTQELVATTDLKQRSELNARIVASNNRMLKLLDDIISVSKIELNE